MLQKKMEYTNFPPDLQYLRKQIVKWITDTYICLYVCVRQARHTFWSSYLCMLMCTYIYMYVHMYVFTNGKKCSGSIYIRPVTHVFIHISSLFYPFWSRSWMQGNYHWAWFELYLFVEIRMYICICLHTKIQQMTNLYLYCAMT